MANRKPSAAQNTARRGRDAAKARLQDHGWAVREVIVEGRAEVLLARDGERRRVRVSAKRRGTWQTSTRYGQEIAPPEMAGRLWIFVDLGGPQSEYYVVPESWMVEDIHAVHAAYLANHGGRRARSPKSTHHAIDVDRIAQWKDRWDLFDA